MAHPELRVSLGRAVRKARKDKVRVRLAGLSFRDGDRDKHVNVHISPLSVDDMTQHYLVIFEPVEGPRAVTRRSTGPGSRPAATDQGGDADRRIGELQEELVETRAHLQSSIDEQDAVHAELQMAHEEVLSINEELQSTNEELMTTKEELQAANEELSTLNDGLRQRNTELQTLSTDLSTLLETVDIPILMLGLDLRIRRYSPRAEAELQLRPQDIGVPINEIRGSVPLVGLEQVIERTIKEGVFQTSEIQGRQGRWYEARVWPHRTPDREIVGSVVALIDVDRIKQAMAAVASARDFSAATVETLQEPLLVLDNHLRVLSANRAFYQTFRLSPERVEQVLLTDLDAGNWNIRELVASVDEIRTNGMALEGLEISHDFERIGPRVVRVNGRRIVQPGSNTENILLALEDVTERKFIDQRLLQAAKMQVVGQLASGVAHEVNNQAQAILGFSAFVHESLDVQDPRRSDLEQVIKAATRSGEIAQGLLAFSRQKQLHPEVLDVKTVVASVEPLLCRVMGPNIEVAVSVDAEVGQVEADRALLEQSLVNLGLNARDAMPEGGRLLVRASSIVVDDDYTSHHHEAGVRHGPYARIEVIDSGVGMDAATQARLFQPFFTTKPAGQGTGLGLASVYGTVTQCKGVVWVESAPGRGTTFTIDLPQVRGTMHSIPGDAPTEVAPRGSETILVVEDEEIIRSWIRRVLRQLGYTVLEAREGAEALRIIQEEGNLIQLVLSDVLMPGMAGRELGQRMTMVRPGLPLLYMSGFTEEEVARQGWLGPDQPLLAKPFGGAALASKIREMLDTQVAGLSG